MKAIWNDTVIAESDEKVANITGRIAFWKGVKVVA